MAASQQARRANDLEEIAPNQFIVNTPQVQTWLKGEGTIQGRLFTLTTWRRDGLIGRLRNRGFRVLTLADQIEALPAPPAPPALGEPRWRPLTHAAERYSRFDPQQLGWQPVDSEEHGSQRGVWLRPGWVLRRRKGRGPAAFYLATPEGVGVGLRALDETAALLTGYAQAHAHGTTLRGYLIDQHARLSLVELPPSHRALLRRFAQQHDGWVTDRAGWALMQALFAQLGVRLVAN